MHGLRRTYHKLVNRFGRTRWNSLVTWVIWNLTSFRLETVLVLGQDRCTVCTKRIIGSEIVLDALEGTLGYEAHVQAQFCPFRHGANLDARMVHGLRQTYHWIGNRFRRTRWNS